MRGFLFENSDYQYTFDIKGNSGIPYSEGERKMVIPFYWPDGIHVLDIDDIKAWDPPYDNEVITYEHKIVILERLYSFLYWRGTDPKRIVINDSLEPVDTFKPEPYVNSGFNTLSPLVYSEGWRKARLRYLNNGPLIVLSPDAIDGWYPPFSFLKMSARKKTKILKLAYAELISQGIDPKHILISLSEEDND